jgi:transposase
MSRYFIMRLGKRVHMGRFPKVSTVCDPRTHLFLSAKVTRGPRHDMCEGPGILRAARRRTRLRRVLLDAGYDAEHTHVLIREKLGAQSIIPPKQGRGTSKWPTGKYRRLMKRSFPKKAYGQRWQAESAFSRDKRLFGSSVRATSWAGQKREAYLRILTHNLALLLSRRIKVFNRARVIQRGSHLTPPPGGLEFKAQGWGTHANRRT